MAEKKGLPYGEFLLSEFLVKDGMIPAQDVIRHHATGLYLMLYMTQQIKKKNS